MCGTTSCIYRVIVPCWSLKCFIGIKERWNCWLPLFFGKLSWCLLSPISDVHDAFSNRDLLSTFGRYLRVTAIAYIALSSSRTTLTNNSKRTFSHLVKDNLHWQSQRIHPLVSRCWAKHHMAGAVLGKQKLERKGYRKGQG